MSRSIGVIAGIVLFAVPSGCKNPAPTPSPFGLLTPAIRDAWARECQVVPFEGDVCQRGSDDAECARIRRDHGDTAQPRFAVVRRLSCPSPGGWAVWADRDGQVFRICIDQDRTDPRDEDRKRPLIRMKQLVTRVYNAGLANRWEKVAYAGDSRGAADIAWHVSERPMGEEPAFDINHRLTLEVMGPPPWGFTLCVDVAFDN